MSWNMGIEVMTKEQVATARKNNIPKKTVYNRTQNLFWTIERAISTPVQSRESQYYTKQDVEEAALNGISYKTFTTRVLTHRWTPERAKTEAKRGGGRRRRED